MSLAGRSKLTGWFQRDRVAPKTSPFALPDLIAPRRMGATMTVAVLVYTGVTTTEIDEPVRALAHGLQADIQHVGHDINPVVGVEPVRTVHVDVSFADGLASHVLVIPGGLGWKRIAQDADAMRWVATAAERAAGILAISTGSLLLASAGHLAGQSATGHWLARQSLAELGAEVSADRSTHSSDSRIVTASGATAALEVCAELAARLRWGP